jgi:hypothetical protein
MDVLLKQTHKFRPRGYVKNNYLQEECIEATTVYCDTKWQDNWEWIVRKWKEVAVTFIKIRSQKLLSGTEVI